MTGSIPTPAVFANVTGLGPLAEIFPVRSAARSGAIVLGGLLSLFGALFVVGAVVYTLIQLDRLGRGALAETVTTFLLPIGGIGLLLEAAGLVLFWKGYRSRNLVAAIYQDGLAYSDHQGIRQYRWTDITALTTKLELEYGEEGISGMSVKYKVYDRNGFAFELADSIQNVGALAAKIQTAIYPHVYAEAAERFNAGKPVTFGRVTIGQKGIDVGKRRISWDQVGHVEVKKGRLHVVRNDKTRAGTVAADAVPNYMVVIALVQQITGSMPGK